MKKKKKDIMKRLEKICSEPEVREKLYQCGFTGAQQIAVYEKNHFARRWAKELGISKTQALQIHGRASRIREKVMHYYASLQTTISSPFFRGMKASPRKEQMTGYYEKLPDYQELFGELLDYQFDKSATVFGFNAYFADLMRITDKYVTEPNKEAIPEGFSLIERRPDLWTIPLNKENAQKEIPYIKIVNERLAAFLMKETGRTQEQIFDCLGTEEVYPLFYPQNLYLKFIAQAVEKAGLRAADIVRILGKDEYVQAAWNIGLSDGMWNLLGNCVEAELAECYGTSEEELCKLSEVKEFCSRCQIDTEELIKLFYQGLSEEERGRGADKELFVNAGEKPLAIKSGMDISEGRIENLTERKLSLLHRVIRLSAITGAAYDALDYALRTLSADGGLGNHELAGLSALLELEQYGISLEQAAALTGNLKIYGESGHKEFADLCLGEYAGTLWNPNGTGEGDVQICSLFALLLHLTMQEVQMLASFFFEEEGVTLNIETVSCLYRHAMFAGILKKNIYEYLLLLEIYGKKRVKFEAGEPEEVIGLNALLEAYGRGIQGWSYVFRPENSVLTVPANEKEILEWAGTLEKQPSKEEEKTYVIAKLADFMGISVEELELTARMYVLCTALPEGIDAWEGAFYAETLPAKEYVVSCIDFLSRWSCMADWLHLSAETLSCFVQNPDAFGMSGNFAEIKPSLVEEFSVLAEFMERYKDSEEHILLWVSEKDDAKKVSLLSGITGWKKADISGFLELLEKPESDAPVLLKRLQDCFDMTGKLQSTYYILKEIAACMEYSGKEGKMLAQQNVLLRNVYGRIQKNADMEKEEVLKRELLLPYALKSAGKGKAELRSPEQLYQYLLIDVNMGGAMKISYIKEAVNALQLYLQRCRLHLEQGVEFLDIPEIWWTYMMNYTFWEANRNVFLYPENFLLPSARRSKTRLFEKVESALMQSSLNDGYMESLYLEYLEEFHRLSQLTITDSMRIKMSDGAEKTPVLYLFGRTKQQPYTFYYCSQKEGMAFSEWMKIDLTIKSEYITPVYAFNRLYIFWVEQKEISNMSIETEAADVRSRESVSYIADIYCSFLNLEGKWVSPQTIAPDGLIYYEDYKEPKGMRSEPAVKNVFQKEELPWLKLYAFSVKPDNLEPCGRKDTGYERLVLAYGLPFKNTGKFVKINWKDEDGSDAVKYDHYLSEQFRMYNRMESEKQIGYLPVESCIVLNQELERSNLLFAGEYYLFDSSWETGRIIPIKMAADYTQNVIGILYSPDVLWDNYTAGEDKSSLIKVSRQQIHELDFTSDTIDSSTSKAVYEGLKRANILDKDDYISEENLSYVNLGNMIKEISHQSGMEISPGKLKEMAKAWFGKTEGAVLFSQAEARDVKIRPVLNQPGWFLLLCKDESFLLKLRKMEMKKGEEEDPFEVIEEGLYISRPAVNELTFYELDEGKDSIFVYLRNAGLTDEDGYIKTERVTRDSVKNALPKLETSKWKSEQIHEAVYRILMNYPTVQSDIFWGEAITKELSEQIFKVLEQKQIIDILGRADTVSLAEADSQKIFGDLMKTGVLTADKLNYIYDRLYHVPRTVAFAYKNKNKPETAVCLYEYMFDAVRLSNGAEAEVRKKLFFGGLDAMLDISTQQIPAIPKKPFERFGPDFNYVAAPEAPDGQQVDFDGLYGNYYWEIFYHIPMLAANTLKGSGKYEEAKKWLEYIFNPYAKERLIESDTFSQETDHQISEELSAVITDVLKETAISKESALSKEGRVSAELSEGTDLYGILEKAERTRGKISKEQAIMIKNVLLNYQLAAPACCYWGFAPFRKYMEKSMAERLKDGSPEMKLYNNDPFDAHAIAGLHIGAYEKYTVISYVKTIMEWADSLFMEDTWESVSFATMLYVLSEELLGERPKKRPVREEEAVTYEEIEKRYAEYPGGIPQFLICLEDEIDGNITDSLNGTYENFPQEGCLYFKVPENQEILSLWEMAEDRLKKIRNSMNIYGEKRVLLLNERSLQAGDILSLNSGSGGGGYELSNTKLLDYRFSYLVEKGKTMASQISQCGAGFLAALEKKDAGELALFRESQEQAVQEALLNRKRLCVDKAKADVDAYQDSIQAMKEKRDYYAELLKSDLIEQEKTGIKEEDDAARYNIASAAVQSAAAAAYAIPQAGSPFAMTYGGIQLGAVLSSGAAGAQIGGIQHQQAANRAAVMASYQRRREEWEFQRSSLEREIAVMEKQKDVYQKEYELASADYELQVLQGQQKNAYYKMLCTMFTNKELYQWTADRLYEIYRQMYQCGMQMLRLVEKTYQYECDTEERFIPANMWRSEYKGLTAGDNMMLILLRMEQAYVECDKKHYELEKIVSVAGTFPEEFEKLRKTGRCEFSFTENMFDEDYPSHYLRKIKSISVSVPVILPAYEMIKATLSQVKNCVLLKPDKEAKELLSQGIIPDSGAVRADFRNNQKIAVSRGIDDTGVFELRFMDNEYMPFEGTGAISDWEFSMPKETNKFDLETIPDVLIKIRYTAKEAGEGF